MTQPIFLDMLDDSGPASTPRFPFPQGKGTLPSESYTGPHLPHDGFRPEWVLLPEEPRWTYMTDKALRLAQWVADRVVHVAIHGPTVVEASSVPGEGTYMSPRAVLKAMALQRRWWKKLRQPVPSQDFPLDEAA